MYKTIDYLNWRGDLSFSKDPINDVDVLIFSLLSYLPLKGIVPGIGAKKGISLKSAADQYSSIISTPEAKFSMINPTASSSFDAEVKDLFEKAAMSPRFEMVELSNYDENTDFILGCQFAAVTYKLHDAKHEKVIAFRGTDSSVVGWKEDFELAYMEQIPAQQSASNYLKRVLGFFPGPFLLCGHSKGGNLAVFSGSNLNPLHQSRLTKIINFDGPGFNFPVVHPDLFMKCERKVINYVPEESLIGLLLEPVGARTVICSEAQLFLQHNALNWNVEGTKFIEGSLSKNAELLENSIKTWLTEISLPNREMFLEALFDILGASEGNVIKSDPQENLQELKKILKKYSELDKETKALLSQVFESLTAEAGKTLTAAISEKLPGKKRSGTD
jgi:hypothetical protein